MVVETEFQPTEMDVARHNRVLDSMEYVELETAARNLADSIKASDWSDPRGCICDVCLTIRKFNAVLAVNKPWERKPEGATE